MQAERDRSLSAPEGVAEALAVLGQGGAVLAGGTWLMRAPGGVAGRLVSPHRIPALGRVDVAPDRITIGAAVTHAALAAALAGMAVGRGVSAVFDERTSFYPNWFYCLVEAIGAGALFWAA